MLKDDPRWTPGARNQADQPLWVVQRFVNTYDAEPATDELDSPAALKEFLVKYCGLPEQARVTAADLARAHEIREAIRQLLLRNNDGRDLSPESVAPLNAAVERADLSVRLDGAARPLLQACCVSGVNAAMGNILAALFNAMNDHTFHHLKACPARRCEWAFYDRSKNHSKTWCSMDVCGNREKARAFRERTKTQTP